jgi:membrane protein required for colicin V production
MTWTDGFDIAVIGLVALSGLVAMARGMVKEALALVGWILAAVVTWIAIRNDASAPVRRVIKDNTIADIATGIVIFLVVLMVCWVIIGWIMRRLPGGTFGIVDALLGLAFGLLRGALFVSLAYLLAEFALKDTMPKWVTDSRSHQWLVRGSTLIKNLNPEEWFAKGWDAIRGDQRR